MHLPMTSPWLVRIPLAACLAFSLFGVSGASAETGRVWIDAGTFVRYENLDLAKQQDRARLVAMVESAAADHCKLQMIRKTGCERRTVDRSFQNAPQAVRKALVLAQTERTPVAQAMR